MIKTYTLSAKPNMVLESDGSKVMQSVEFTAMSRGQSRRSVVDAPVDGLIASRVMPIEAAININRMLKYGEEALLPGTYDEDELTSFGFETPSI